jgi:hypothetical protein
MRDTPFPVQVMRGERQAYGVPHPSGFLRLAELDDGRWYAQAHTGDGPKTLAPTREEALTHHLARP